MRSADVDRGRVVGSFTLDLSTDGVAAVKEHLAEVSAGGGALGVGRRQECVDHDDGCWQIGCGGCSASVADHVLDPNLIGAILDAFLNHRCAGPVPDTIDGDRPVRPLQLADERTAPVRCAPDASTGR